MIKVFYVVSGLPIIWFHKSSLKLEREEINSLKKVITMGQCNLISDPKSNQKKKNYVQEQIKTKKRAKIKYFKGIICAFLINWPYKVHTYGAM